MTPISKTKPPNVNHSQCRITNLMTAMIPYKIAQIATKTKSFVIQYISEPKVPPGETQYAISCTISPTINKITNSQTGAIGNPKGSVKIVYKNLSIRRLKDELLVVVF